MAPQRASNASTTRGSSSWCNPATWVGKGAALRRGFSKATSDFVIVQDADLEYDPADYGVMITPMLSGGRCRLRLTISQRSTTSRPNFLALLGNRILTAASNIATNLNLSDIETGYKAFRPEVLQSFTTEENRFGFEPEITAKVARGG